MTNESNLLPVNNDKPIKEFFIILNSDLVKNLFHEGMVVVRLLDVLQSYGYAPPSDYEFAYSHSNDISFSTAFSSVFKLSFYSNKEVPIDQMMMQIALQLDVNVIDVTEFL